MNSWGARAATAAAFLFAAIYLAAATGFDLRRSGAEGSPGGAASTYHGGKSAAPASPDPACQSKGCHAAYPHAKDRTESAFRNMHQEFADCLSCHGRDPENHWAGDPPGRGRRIRYEPGKSAGKDPHSDLGRAIGCRTCHSAAGLARLREKGMSRMRSDQSDPVALRMIEGGPRRWAPPDLR